MGLFYFFAAGFARGGGLILAQFLPEQDSPADSPLQAM
jgi:hypothetical protein